MRLLLANEPVEFKDWSCIMLLIIYSGLSLKLSALISCSSSYLRIMSSCVIGCCTSLSEELTEPADSSCGGCGCWMI